MTVYQPGDVILVAFPFSSGSSAKARPAMVVLDTGDNDVVVARITTQLRPTPCDVVLIDWQGAGLLAPSMIRLHKLATLEKGLVHRALGSLQAPDRAQVAAVLQQTFVTWK
jgi:mRNA interferase MazF